MHATITGGAGLLAVALVAPGIALADSFQRDRTPLPPSLAKTGGAEAGGAAGGGLARLLIGLVLVVGLLLAIAWLVRRANRGRFALGGMELPVIATARLAPTRAVHLLRVGDELVLIGSAEQGVTPIRVYPAAEAEALAEMLERDETSLRLSGRSSGGAFSLLLDDLRRRTAR